MNRNEEMLKQLSNDHRSAQVIEVKQIDVLCGKGKKSFHHEGNVYFRDLVCDMVESFVTGKTAIQRSKVIQDAIDHVHSRGGRFLRRHQVDGTWVVMKQDHVLEKVRNSFRDAAKKVPMKKHQNRFSKGIVRTFERTYKKSLSFEARSNSQQQFDEFNNSDTSMNDVAADQHRYPLMATSASLTKQKSDISGEFYDFDLTPSNAGTESDDDNEMFESSHHDNVFGVSKAAASSRIIDHHSSLLESEQLFYNSNDEQQYLSGYSNIVKSQGLETKATSNDMQDETLEDLLCAVDSALHWKASTPASIPRGYDGEQFSKINYDEVGKVHAQPDIQLRNSKHTVRYDRRLSESHDSNFIGMIDQVLGPLHDGDSQPNATTFTSDRKTK